MYREDVLVHAYQLVRAKRGAAGVDGQSFTAIEAHGEGCWLGELAQALKDKTHRCRVPQATFYFMSYSFGRCYSPTTGRAYIGTRPSKSSIRQVCRQIRALTQRRTLLADPEDRVERINRLMVGWANYFQLGPVSKAYDAVDAHARFRLREWLRKKHKQPGRGIAQYPDEYLYDVLGLTRLTLRTHDLPWAKA